MIKTSTKERRRLIAKAAEARDEQSEVLRDLTTRENTRALMLAKIEGLDKRITQLRRDHVDAGARTAKAEAELVNYLVGEVGAKEL